MWTKVVGGILGSGDWHVLSPRSEHRMTAAMLRRKDFGE